MTALLLLSIYIPLLILLYKDHWGFNEFGSNFDWDGNKYYRLRASLRTQRFQNEMRVELVTESTHLQSYKDDRSLLPMTKAELTYIVKVELSTI